MFLHQEAELFKITFLSKKKKVKKPE
jgi:hypothetical protein